MFTLRDCQTVSLRFKDQINLMQKIYGLIGHLKNEIQLKHIIGLNKKIAYKIRIKWIVFINEIITETIKIKIPKNNVNELKKVIINKKINCLSSEFWSFE
jgi:hypothetical protein